MPSDEWLSGYRWGMSTAAVVVVVMGLLLSCTAAP